jgi:hypothetical protein
MSNLIIRREQELRTRIVATAPPSLILLMLSTRRAMTPLEYTITRYIEARSDAEHWQALCVDWLKTNGRGHSHTFDMLAHRRFSRKCLRIARREEDNAMSILTFAHPADPEGTVEACDGFGDPPADIVADTRGLPPMRAALARHLAWIASVEGDLAKLAAGRAKLLEQIEHAKAAQATAAADAAAGAETIIDRIRRNLDWSLGAVISSGAMDRAASITASGPHIPVAEAALTKLDAEIARTEALLETLRTRKPRFVAAAAREAADGLYADYATAIDNLREIMTQLAGLDAALGAPRPGPLVAVLPDLVGSSGLDELPILAPPAAIADASRVWLRFVGALATDPRAPASMLEFPPVNPNAPDPSCYHEKHALERRVIDVNFAQQKG